MMSRGQPVRTAVIPAGGYGTRFLPSTKSIPKEMFPLWNKPVILHVVEELVASGITEIIFIVSHHKQSIESFFAANEILEDYYLKNGKVEQVEELRRIEKLAPFVFVYTQPPYGNGGCLGAVEHLIKDEPFVFIWADELIVANSKTPRVRQCLDVYEKYGLPVISSVRIPDPEDRVRYGMAEMEPFKKEKNVQKILRIVEKPDPGTEPSEWAAHGAYVLDRRIFDALHITKPGRGGELWLTDILKEYGRQTDILACQIEGDYYDCGNPITYLKSQLGYASKHSPAHAQFQRLICTQMCHFQKDK